MKNAASCFALFLLSAGASACPLSDIFIARYGISDGGMLSPPPATKPNADPAFLQLTLAYSGLVNDGFRHTLFVDRKASRAWLRRTGGVLGVREWYGPIDIRNGWLEGCRDDGAVRRDGHDAMMKDIATLSVQTRPAPRTP